MGNIPVYEGGKPYIFISYAHANSPAVMQVAELLCERGCRVWYDGGVEVGSEWPEYIASHLAGAGLMIAFLSNAYIRSDNCRKEMHYALTKKIPLINVFLEETSLTPGMEMQIGNIFALMKYSMSDQVFEEKLFGAPQLGEDLQNAEGPEPKKNRTKKKKKAAVPVDIYAERRRKKRRRIVSVILASVLTVTALVLGIVGWSTGLIPRLINRRAQAEIPEQLPETTEILWHDAVLEKAARAYTGIEEGPVSVLDLSGITELHVRGDRCAFDRGALPETEHQGELQDLSDLRCFPNLEYLFLEDQALSSLETLPPCRIEIMTIHNCDITSLQGIGRLTQLRELNVLDCPLRKLGDLDHCLELRELSLSGCFVSDLSAVKPLLKLAEVSLSDLSLEEMKVVFGLSSLTNISLYDCDLRGQFFYSFDREWRLVSMRLSDCKLNNTRNLEDFSGLTTVSLIRTGETLDWSPLARLPVLKTVYGDATMEAALRSALDGSKIDLYIED